MKDFIVSVFNNHTGPNCRNRPLAYLRYIPQPNTGCVHAVSAETGTRVKQKAIKEHLNSLTCTQHVKCKLPHGIALPNESII